VPKFKINLEDIEETYLNLDLNYVLKYGTEVPLKYHEIKAEYIVNLSRQARYL
jgi:uncharacterized alkaline shock family protein YloU